jgi:ribonuclease HI
VLVLGWKAKKNKALVASIRELILKFADIKIIPVKGHQGIQGNERADQLATAAIPNTAKKNRQEP